MTEPENGIYVQNGNFATADDLSGENGSEWEFMTKQNGEATAEVVSDNKLNLTTEKQTYTYEFTVTDHDDTNARLEFNLGKTDPISDVYISNVKMEKTETVEIDDSKKVMTDGNDISNGKF